MNIEYIARRVTLTEQIRQLTEKKLRKITKYFNNILDIRVEIGLERHLHVADISVKGKDFDIKSTAQNKELTTAIHEAIEKLDIQGRRAKTRLKGRKRQADEHKVSPAWSEDVIEPTSVSAGEPRIVQHQSIPVKPMTIEEAMLQLQETSDDFIVFFNATTERVNVLYRRRDKNLGLITPEM